MDTKALRRKILDLAIRGQLVPQDPADEPASVLLDRIRAEKQKMVKEGKLKAKDIKNDSIIFVGEDSLHYEKFADGNVKCIEDEIPFELPEGWAWERLGNVSTIARGGSPRPIEDFLTDDKNGINWIKIGDTEKDGKYILHTKERIKAAGLSKTRYVRSGDFLLTNSMSFGRPYILKTDGCIHDGWLVIGNIKTVFSQDYLYYALSSGFMYTTLSLLAAGSTVKNLKSDTVRSVLFPIPPLDEQERLARRLEELISFIDSINADEGKLVRIIEQTKSKILDLAIRGQLVPQDPNDEPASVLLERIRAEKEELIKQGKIKRDNKESVIFRGEDNSYYEKVGGEVQCIDNEIPFDIPETWAFVRLKHIGTVIGGGTPKTNVPSFWDGEIPWLTPADLSGHKEIYVSAGGRNIKREGLDSSSAQLMPAGAVLYSSRAPIGYVAISANPIATNQGFKSVVPYDFSMSEYLYYCLQARTPDIEQRATGTTFKEISGSAMAETIIPLPPIAEQQRIVSCVQSYVEKLFVVEKQIN